MTKDNIPRLVLLALAGAVAGLLVFAMLDPSMARSEQTGSSADTLLDAYMSSMILGAVLAAALGGMLSIANEIGSSPLRIAIRTFSSTGIGAVLGALAGVCGEFVFIAMIAVMGPIGVIVGRTIGWAIIGAGAGVGVGFVIGSWKRAGMGALGGLLGGAAGGLLFDVLVVATDAGSVSRFFGFVIIGMATGVAIAYIEEVAKQSWVTILSGSREGKTHILTKSATTIGRDELADIPLFGDPGIAKHHATLNTTASAVTIAPTGGPVLVNGSPAAANAQLRAGDTIGIGRVSLRFNQKAGQFFPAPSSPSASPMQPTPAASIMAPTGTIRLTVLTGPYSGHWYQSGPGLLRIGREDTCSINLSQDPKVSRNHAEILWDGSNWSITDPGSTNGLWVNNDRITSRLLAIGDQIGVGQTVLRVDGL